MDYACLNERVCDGRILRRPSRRTGTLIFVAVSMSMIVPVLGLPETATAHMAPSGWVYPVQCCSNQDCEPIHDARVTEGPQGYVVQDSGEIIGYRDTRVKKSPDDEFHLCRAQRLPPSRTICLFVPPRSF